MGFKDNQRWLRKECIKIIIVVVGVLMVYAGRVNCDGIVGNGQVGSQTNQQAIAQLGTQFGAQIGTQLKGNPNAQRSLSQIQALLVSSFGSPQSNQRLPKMTQAQLQEFNKVYAQQLAKLALGQFSNQQDFWRQVQFKSEMIAAKKAGNQAKIQQVMAKIETFKKQKDEEKVKETRHRIGLENQQQQKLSQIRMALENKKVDIEMVARKAIADTIACSGDLVCTKRAQGEKKAKIEQIQRQMTKMKHELQDLEDKLAEQRLQDQKAITEKKTVNDQKSEIQAKTKLKQMLLNRMKPKINDAQTAGLIQETIQNRSVYDKDNVEVELKAKKQAEEKEKVETELRRQEIQKQLMQQVQEQNRKKRQGEERKRMQEEKKRQDQIRRQQEQRKRRQAEERARRQAQEAARIKNQADLKKMRDQEQAHKRAEDENRRRQVQEANRRTEDQERKRVQQENKRKVEEEMRIKQEEDNRRLNEESFRRKIQDQMRKKVEEETRKKIEEQTRKKIQQQVRKKIEEQVRKKAQEQVKKKLQQQAKLKIGVQTHQMTIQQRQKRIKQQVKQLLLDSNIKKILQQRIDTMIVEQAKGRSLTNGDIQRTRNQVLEDMKQKALTYIDNKIHPNQSNNNNQFPFGNKLTGFLSGGRGAGGMSQGGQGGQGGSGDSGSMGQGGFSNSGFNGLGLLSQLGNGKGIGNGFIIDLLKQRGGEKLNNMRNSIMGAQGISNYANINNMKGYIIPQQQLQPQPQQQQQHLTPKLRTKQPAMTYVDLNHSQNKGTSTKIHNNNTNNINNNYQQNYYRPHTNNSTNLSFVIEDPFKSHQLQPFQQGIISKDSSNANKSLNKKMKKKKIKKIKVITQDGQKQDKQKQNKPKSKKSHKLSSEGSKKYKNSGIATVGSRKIKQSKKTYKKSNKNNNNNNSE